MDEDIKVYEYEADGYTALWRPKLCIHSEKCVKGLPKVFKPKEKPWIQTENSTKEELTDQIMQCPSGALGYRLEGKKNVFSTDNDQKTNGMEESKIKATVLENGPLMCEGPIEVTKTDGTKETKDKVFFCRCGASSNKPYCDGSHSKADFKG